MRLLPCSIFVLQGYIYALGNGYPNEQCEIVAHVAIVDNDDGERGEEKLGEETNNEKVGNEEHGIAEMMTEQKKTEEVIL